MQLKTKVEENKCFSSESRGFRKYMLMGLGLAVGSYIISDSIFYLDEEHDAIIVNKLWGEKRLVEKEGFYLKLPLFESKHLIHNLYNIDLINLIATELKESISDLKLEYKFSLPSTQEMMEVYGVSSKEELYQEIWNDISLFLTYNILSPQLNKILTLYLGNLIEKCKAVEPFLNRNFNIINEHYNNKFFVEFHSNNLYGMYEPSTNTVKIPHFSIFHAFFYSLSFLDPEFLRAKGIEYNEEILFQSYSIAVMEETRLIEALVHEIIHAQSIMNEAATQVLTQTALAEAAKIDKDFELYARISIYFNLLGTLNLLKIKNIQEMEGINLPSRKMREEFYGQYTIEWYKQIVMSLLTDNKLFIPEKKVSVDVSSLKQYFSKLEELRD